jgi:hypothetical protein
MSVAIPRPLVCHPATPATLVEDVRAMLDILPGGDLALSFRVTADPARLRVPPRAPSGRADGLWRHTCFEAFVAVPETLAYREFNFSPSGQWQVYAFHAYRAGGPLESALTPAITLELKPNGLNLHARIPSADLPPGDRLRLALSAVLEAADGSLSYWALRHPPGRPDFHHPDTFALEIDLQESQP